VLLRKASTNIDIQVVPQKLEKPFDELGYVAVLMITAGYMGAVSVVTTVKWFWFLFGMAMFLPVIYSLARTFRETVITRKDPEMIELYGKIAWLTIIMWSFYPVVWLFSEGFASFSVSFEVLPIPFHI